MTFMALVSLVSRFPGIIEIIQIPAFAIEKLRFQAGKFAEIHVFYGNCHVFLSPILEVFIELYDVIVVYLKAVFFMR